jgi:hypothetical protein
MPVKGLPEMAGARGVAGAFPFWAGVRIGGMGEG